MEFWRNYHIFDLRGFRGTVCCGVARCGAGEEFCRKKTVKGCFFRVSRKNLDDFLIAIIIVRPSGRCQWFAAKKTKIRRRDWKWLETCRIIQGIITKIIQEMSKTVGRNCPQTRQTGIKRVWGISRAQKPQRGNRRT